MRELRRHGKGNLKQVQATMEQKAISLLYLREKNKRAICSLAKRHAYAGRSMLNS